jgi:hypothetical protein
MKRTIYAFGIFSFLCLQTGISQDTIVLQPGAEGKDAQINSINNSFNYEDTPVLKSMAWTHSGIPGQHRGLIEFDLSLFSPESTILNASLDLYYRSYETNGQTHTGDNASYLLKITEPWEEDVVSWNNPPATTSNNAVILPTSTDPEQN